MGFRERQRGGESLTDLQQQQQQQHACGARSPRTGAHVPAEKSLHRPETRDGSRVEDSQLRRKALKKVNLEKKP